MPMLENHSPSQSRLEAPPTPGSIHPTFAHSLHRREWCLRGFHPQSRACSSKTAILIQDALLATLCYLMKKFCLTPFPLKYNLKRGEELHASPGWRRALSSHTHSLCMVPPLYSGTTGLPCWAWHSFSLLPQFWFLFFKSGATLQLEIHSEKTRYFFFMTSWNWSNRSSQATKCVTQDYFLAGLLLLSRAQDMEEHFILILEPPDCSLSVDNEAFSIMHGQGKYSNKVLAKDLPLTHLCSKLLEVSRLSRNKHSLLSLPSPFSTSVLLFGKSS